VDGEPWEQEVADATDSGPLKVHIKLASVPGRVLVNKQGLPLKVCNHCMFAQHHQPSAFDNLADPCIHKHTGIADRIQCQTCCQGAPHLSTRSSMASSKVALLKQ
jgi:hypothetical protein